MLQPQEGPGNTSPGPGDSSVRPEMSVRPRRPGATRNLSVLVRPERRTVLVEPRPGQCQGNLATNITTNLLIAVFSAPANSVSRAIVR